MIRSSWTVAAAILVLTSPLAAQRNSSNTSGAFLVTLGKDTISAEQYTRYGTSCRGHTSSAPRRSGRASTRRRSRRTARSAASTSRATLASKLDAKMMRRTVAAPQGDSMVVEMTANGKTNRLPALKLPAGTLPMFGGSFALEELVVQRFAALKKNSASLSIAFVGAPAAEIPIKRIGSDSVVIMLPNNDQHLRIDREGRMLGMRSPNSTVKIEVTRLPSIDLAAYAAAWSSRPLGQPRQPTR